MLNVINLCILTTTGANSSSSLSLEVSQFSSCSSPPPLHHPQGEIATYSRQITDILDSSQRKREAGNGGNGGLSPLPGPCPETCSQPLEVAGGIEQWRMELSGT